MEGKVELSKEQHTGCLNETTVVFSFLSVQLLTSNFVYDWNCEELRL